MFASIRDPGAPAPPKAFGGDGRTGTEGGFTAGVAPPAPKARGAAAHNLEGIPAEVAARGRAARPTTTSDAMLQVTAFRWERLSVDGLKAECADRGLRTNGLRSDLLARLRYDEDSTVTLHNDIDHSVAVLMENRERLRQARADHPASSSSS